MTPAATEGTKPPLDVLLLQGPVGGFFTSLAKDLSARGFSVARVTFNLGDHLFAGNEECLPFAAPLDALANWLETVIRTRGVKRVVLFGDARPVHRIAIDVCRALDIPVWCLEEGYIRPGYITVERGGNNARSPLARAPKTPETGPWKKEPITAERELPRLVLLAIAQHCAARIGCLAGFGTMHRPRPLIGEAIKWLRNAARFFVKRRANRAVAEALCTEHSKQFYLVALQVHDDMQLQHYGRGWTMRDVIETTMRSFAANAPQDTKLVFKVHPLDRGHQPYARWVSRESARFGLSSRVQLIETGPLAMLPRHARAMLTVNSTAGISGLHHNCPVLALGDAFYIGRGLAEAGRTISAIDTFWTNATPPDAKVWTEFRERIMRDALVPGSYYAANTRKATVSAVARRISEGLGNTITLPTAKPAAAKPALPRPALTRGAA